MANSYRIISLDQWKRAEHYRMFLQSFDPTVTFTFDVDVTRLWNYCRETNLSFTLAMIYLVSRCADGIEDFRYRSLDGNVVLYDHLDTVFSWLDETEELFKVVRVPMTETMESYVELAQRTIREQKEHFPDVGPLDFLRFAPVPWLPYTQASHTFAGTGHQDLPVPLIGWGKCREEKDRVTLPFTVRFHHSYMDAISVGKLLDAMEAEQSRL